MVPVLVAVKVTAPLASKEAVGFSPVLIFSATTALRELVFTPVDQAFTTTLSVAEALLTVFVTADGSLG